MSNSDHLHSLVSDGKLHISLDDTIALALENNLDIAIARFEPAYAQTDMLRTRSGGAPRGVQARFPPRPCTRVPSEAVSAVDQALPVR